jgi:hypothetical protein
MVQQALNRHSQIAIPPETKFFFSFFGHGRAQQLRHIKRLDADLGICLPRPATRIVTPKAGRAFFNEMAQQYVAKLGKPGVVAFGEKTPEHSGYLPRIRQLFPEARIIVLYRDGRDVAASLSRMPWMSPNLYVNFLVWTYYNWILCRARREGVPNLYFARYESIVADPAEQMASILDFLELPYEPSVAAGCGNKAGIPEREYAWKARALQPITRQRVGVFRRDLTGEQIAFLERLGRMALPALGYELLTDGRQPLPPGFLIRLSYSVLRFAWGLPWASVLKEMLENLVRGSVGGIHFPFDEAESRVKPPRPTAASPRLLPAMRT